MKAKNLREWLQGLDREQLEKVAKQCLDELILNDEVRYYPNDSEYDGPIWKASGTVVGEHE